MQHAVNVQIPGWDSFLTSLSKIRLPANPLELNLPFLQSIPGAFKIAHTVLGMICLILIAYFSQFVHPITGSSLGLLCSKSAAYFLLVSYGFFVTSFILLICSTVSYFTASFLPKTAFELVYHLVACFMYLSSSLILLSTVISDYTEAMGFKEPGFEAKIAVSILGILNSILYGISTFFSIKAKSN